MTNTSPRGLSKVYLPADASSYGLHLRAGGLGVGPSGPSRLILCSSTCKVSVQARVLRTGLRFSQLSGGVHLSGEGNRRPAHHGRSPTAVPWREATCGI